MELRQKAALDMRQRRSISNPAAARILNSGLPQDLRREPIHESSEGIRLAKKYKKEMLKLKKHILSLYKAEGFRQIPFWKDFLGNLQG